MKHLPLLLALLCSLATAARANTAVQPLQRNAEWTARHEGFAALARAGGIDVLFIGDSITADWRKTGHRVWEKYFAPLRAANFGTGADRTQNLLWRLPRGELEGPPPKVIVLLIGTNNIGFERSGKIRNTTTEAIEGVMAVIDLIQSKQPASKILLLGLFPRGEKTDPIREQVAEVNAALRTRDDGDRIRFLDIGHKFLSPDGSISPQVMPDLLHPSELGYEIWANAMMPLLTEMLAQP
jgi:Lysophospholipase L1 and related esterases